MLPSEYEIKAKANSLFNEVKVEIHQIPFTIESARSSLLKINEKQPPSDKNQQFKDGVIWADCMTLLEKADVIFVTGDKAFFRDRDFNNGLAINLKDETNASVNEFKIYSSLTELLVEIKTDIVIDNIALVSKFTETIKDSVNSLLERNEFSLSSEAVVNLLQFVTEDPDKLFIEFQIHFKCTDTRGEGRTDGNLLLEGDGYYALEKAEFLELRNRGEELSFKDGSGERIRQNRVLLIGSTVISHRNVEHVVKYEIE